MWDVAKVEEEQQKVAKEEHEGKKLPSLEQETNTEQGGEDLQTTSTQLK